MGMKSLVYFFLALLLVTRNLLAADEVIIYKQWHLSPKVNAYNFKQTQKLPQKANQIDIYKKIKQKITRGESSLVLMEGCTYPQVVDLDYQEKFNQMNVADLIKIKKDKNFENYMAPIAYKIEAYFGDKVKTLCADDAALIKEQSLALSDLRGFTGFYMRFKQIDKKRRPEKWQAYQKALEKLENKKVASPLQYTREKALEALDRFEKLSSQRNLVFFKAVKEHQKEKPMVIVGGLHAQELSKLLKEASIAVTIDESLGHPKDEMKLVEKLKGLLK